MSSYLTTRDSIRVKKEPYEIEESKDIFDNPSDCSVKEKRSFSLESDTLHQFSIHKIKVSAEEVNKISKEERKGELYALAIWIDRLVNRGSQNKMQFQELHLGDKTWWHSHLYYEFHVKIYHSAVPKSNKIGRFLHSFGIEGNFESHSVHYLFFFYRQLLKTTDLGKIQLQEIDYEAFVLTTGQAWQALSRRDYQFPIQIFKRIASAKHIKMQTSRNLTGPTLISSLLYNRPLASVDSDHLYHIVTHIRSLLREKSYLRSQYPLATQRGPTSASITVEIGVGSIKIGRQLPLPGYAFVLDYFSKVCSGETFYCLEDSGKRLSIIDFEEDDPNLTFLDLVQPVEDGSISQLESVRKELMWRMFQGEQGINLYFCHKYALDFFSSPLIPFFRGQKLLSNPDFWDHPPPLEEVLGFLRNIPEIQSNKDAFFEALKQLRISFFRSGQLHSFSLMDCVEGEIKTKEGETYFYIGGTWQQTSVEYHALLQKDFNLLLEDHLVKEGEPAYLPRPWINQLEWASFSLQDLSAILSNAMQANSVLGSLQQVNSQTSKPFCSPLKKDKTRYVMNIRVSLSQMNLDQLTKSALEKFLNEKADLAANTMAEGPYNETYLYDQMNNGLFFGPDEGWVVGDRIDHTGRKIEIFDVAKYTKDACYLFHVKEGFGGTTRVACSQIRNSAKQLQQFRLANASSSVIEEFWNEVVNSSQGGYRQKLKGQLEYLGLENFKSIFNRSRIVFVYAFLDSEGESERLLLNEGRQIKEVIFQAADFNDATCLNYRNRPNTTPHEIFQLLDNKGYLSEGKVTDKFLVCAKSGFFLHEKLGKTTQHPAIYDIIMRHLSPFLSQYDSTIAKVELLTIRSELQQMGFEFNICQIRRPQGAVGRTIVKTEITLPSPAKASYNKGFRLRPNRSFVFENKKLTRVETQGRGSCALHASLGINVGGVYRYPQRQNPDYQAKNDFLVALGNTQNAQVLTLHKNNFSALLSTPF